MSQLDRHLTQTTNIYRLLIIYH